MTTTEVAVGVLAAVLLVLANGFFVAAEFAIVKVRETQLAPLVRTSARARLALHLTQHLDAYLAACQVGITLSSLALGWIGEPAIAGIIEPPLATLVGGFAPAASHVVAVAVAFTFIAAMHIVLGELAPKSIAIQRALPTAMAVAYPLHVFYKVMYPFIAVLNTLGNMLVRSIGLRPATEAEHAHSPEELALLLVDAGEAGALEPGERDVARRALTLGDRSVRTLMIPRTEIVSVPETAPITDVLAISSAHPFTRLPVHHQDRDEIVGVIHVRDLAHAAERGSRTAADLMRPVALLPETTDLLEALATFRRERVVVGVVVDEHGGTSGIVTLGAIAEHLLGPVGDEFAPARTHIERRPDGSLLVDGRTPIADLREAAGLDLARVDADTAAGFVVERLGRIARAGDTVQEEGATFTVLEMEGHRVDRLAMTRPQARVGRPA